jgi:hypothetical protein
MRQLIYVRYQMLSPHHRPRSQTLPAARVKDLDYPPIDPVALRLCGVLYEFLSPLAEGIVNDIRYRIL